MGKFQEIQPLDHHVDGAQNGCCRAIMEDCCEASMESSSMELNSVNSEASSSLDIVEEDAISPISSNCSFSSSSSSSNGPLYELSELMAHLPIKRGLSKYYDGKSESFTCLASVERLEDLAKRVSPIRKKFKSCKNFGGGFDGHRSMIPRATIAKKASRSRGKTSLICGSRSAISVNWH